MKYPITPDYLSRVPDSVVKLYQDLEDYLIRQICGSLSISGEPNATALELIRQLQRRGMPLETIEERIKRTLKLSDQQLKKALENAVQRNNAYYDAAFDALGLVEEQAQLDEMAAEIDSITRQTEKAMHNITRSMGFGMRGLDGSVIICDAQRTYQTILDKAELRVLSSGASYNVAIRDGIREMTGSGLIGEWVEYRDEEGKVYHRNRVDVAVRRAVMTGVSQISAQRSEMAAEELDTPLREISAHRGARDVDGPHGWENHKEWQGKVYSTERGDDKYPYIYTATGWGAVDGLEGANCRHMHFPFVEGFSERTYTDEELANIDKPPFTYQGREYSAYEATQKQREIETALRRVKRRLIGFKAAGDDEAYTAEAVRYLRLNEEYTKFSAAADLPTQRERSNIAEFGPAEAKAARAAARSA
jgi:DNA-binding transcriptional MerR regulator